MNELTHGFIIDKQECEGCLACMRACPTHAIRVKAGKAHVFPHLCVDCGMCLSVCSSGAIHPSTLTFAELDRYKFKVAVPSYVLLGQFPIDISFEHIVEGLKAFGFDAIWDYEVELALVNHAIKEYVEKWEGPLPLISSACPVVVRLIQVSYPEMVDQLIRVQPARELAGRAIKQKYSKEIGFVPGEIAAIYISPCQAKTISILEPAERAKSYLDGALGISEVYNKILTVVYDSHTNRKTTLENLIHKAGMLRWVTSRWQDYQLSHHRYMYISGLSNVIQVLDDIEKGKLRSVEYIDCKTCWDGCIGGNLTVDDVYVAHSKIQRLRAELPDRDPELEAKIKERLPTEDFSLRGEIRPRVSEKNLGDLQERIKRMKFEETILQGLPFLDCGLCGAPTCRSLAHDIAQGEAKKNDCIFFSDDRLAQLRKTYLDRNK